MTQAAEPNESKFVKLVRLFLLKRWPGDSFLKHFVELQDISNIPVSPQVLTKTVFQAVDSQYLDPLFIEYICLLIKDPRVNVTLASVVDLIHKDTALALASDSKHLLLISIAKTASSVDPDDNLLPALADYLQHKDQCSGQELRALGFLLTQVADTITKNFGDNPSYKNLKSSMDSYLNILAELDVSMRDRLKTLYSIDDISNSDSKKDPSAAEDEAQQQAAAALKASVVTDMSLFSRVFRLIWLEKMLFSYNLIQGEDLLHEISILFNDTSSKVILESLITTSFDGLAVSMLRKDDQRLVNLWGSFITKSLPILVKHFITDIPQPYVESVVCRPISSLDRAIIVQISGGGDTLDEMFSSFPPTTVDFRAHFLQACVDLKLISVESMKRTLGNDTAYTDPDPNQLDGGDQVYRPIPGGQSTDLISIASLFENNIVQEHPDAIPMEESTLFNLINYQFGDLDGIRQAEIASRTLDLVKEWAANSSNASRSLGHLCLAWAQNCSALDVLFLHISPMDVFKPLVKSLDNWSEDEDETNFQDRYTDFGHIYLLICLIYMRYDIRIEYLPDWSFSKTQLQQLDIPVGSFTLKNLEDLPDRQKELLGGWISALFDGGGISDDLMRLSSIQQLIELVPIILQQIMSACDKKIVDMETLKGGLDYLRQPFLAFTLVVGFQYLCQSIWRSKTMSAAQIVVIQELVFASERSSETQRIHDVVLSIMNDKFVYAFNANIASAAAANIPANDIATKVIQTLRSKDSHNHRPKFIPESSNSLASIIKEHVAILVSWSFSIESGNAVLPWYNFDTLHLAMQFLGWSKATEVLLDELSMSYTQGTFDTTLDVISIVIFLCAGEIYNLLISDEYEASIQKPVKKTENTKNSAEDNTTTKNTVMCYQKLKTRLLAFSQRFANSKLPVGDKWLIQAVDTEEEQDIPINSAPEEFTDKGFSYDDDVLDPNGLGGLDVDMDSLFNTDMNM